MRTTSTSKRRKFRPETHNTLIESDDTFNLQLNAAQRSSNLIRYAYVEGNTKIHLELFQDLFHKLTRSPTVDHTHYPIPLFGICTGYSDCDRENLMDIFIERYSAEMAQCCVCTANISLSLCQSAEDLFVDATNFLVRNSEIDKNKRTENRRPALDINKSSAVMSPVETLFAAADSSLLSAVGEEITLERSMQLVLTITFGECIDSSILGDFIMQLNRYVLSQTDTTSVVIVLMFASSVPVPLLLSTHALSRVVICHIYRTPSPITVLENVISAVLTNTLIPFTVSPEQLQKMVTMFLGYEQCVWSAVQRLNGLLAQHFSTRKLSLFLMYRDLAFMREWRTTGATLISSADTSTKITTREKVVKWILFYIGESALPAEIATICTIAKESHRSEARKAGVLTRALDFSMYLHYTRAVRIDILQKIRAQYLPGDDRKETGAIQVLLGDGNELYRKDSHDFIELILDTLRTGLQHSTLVQMHRMMVSLGDVLCRVPATGEEEFDQEGDIAEDSALKNVFCGYEHLASGLKEKREEHRLLVALFEDLLRNTSADVCSMRLNNLKETPDILSKSDTLDENDWTNYCDATRIDVITHMEKWKEIKVVDTTHIIERLCGEVQEWVKSVLYWTTDDYRITPDERILMDSLVCVGQENQSTLVEEHQDMGNLRKRTFDALRSVKSAAKTPSSMSSESFDVSVLHALASDALQSKREIPISELFDLFCKYYEENLYTGITRDTKESKVKQKPKEEASTENIESDILARLQCRFMFAFNELQRIGYITLAPTGNLVRRSLMS